MNTPWGKAHTVENYAEGITVVYTPSHGGILLSEERDAQIPEPWRNFARRWAPARWYEEDCAAQAVMVVFGDELGISQDVRESAREVIVEYAGELAPQP